MKQLMSFSIEFNKEIQFSITTVCELLIFLH